MREYTETENSVNALHLPCPSCGNHLEYLAENRSICCSHCGYEEALNKSNDQVIEKDLHAAIKDVDKFIPEEGGKKVFDCGNCGAKFMVEHDKLKVNCGFCGSKNVNLDAHKHQYIKPLGIIPFYVSREEANKKFNRWIKQGAFHPNKLRRMAALEDLHGVYIPFWTYDAKTQSTWSGEAGHYSSQGAAMPSRGRIRNQRVPQVNWRSRKGNIEHFFDDVLVVASGELAQEEMDKVTPYRLEEVVNYDPRLLMGWEAEVYQIEINDGYKIAEQIIDHRLRNMCSAQLGGDTQRNLHVNSRKSAQTYKHLILPLWICSYTYQGKIYRFLINGQTGRVNGQKPLSYFKIGILILLFILFLVGIWYLRYSGVLQGKFNF